MSEIAQLFESALRTNRSQILRQAAMKTIARMPKDVTLRELLESDAGPAVRELSFGDFRVALSGVRGVRRRVARGPASTAGARRRVAVPAGGSGKVRAGDDGEASDRTPSEEEALYRAILDAVQEGPLTIGQIAKKVGLSSAQVRTYVRWMRSVGKLASEGRARATRYFVPDGHG